jgi:hypothetical protein
MVDHGDDHAVVEGRRDQHPVGHVGEGNSERRPRQHHAVCPGLAHHRRSARAAPGDVVGHVGQGRGQQHVTGHHTGQQLVPHRLRPELGQRHGAQDDRGPQRHRRHRAALALEDDGQLDHAVATTAVGLG